MVKPPMRHALGLIGNLAIIWLLGFALSLAR